MSVKQMSLAWELDLAPNKRLVLLAYADHADDEGDNVYPSLGRMAHKTGYSPQQVRRISRELVEDGLMELVEKNVGRSNANRYRLTLEKGIKLQPFKPKRDKAEKVTSRPEKVTSRPEKVPPMVPEPSEPSVEPSSSTRSGETPEEAELVALNKYLTDELYSRIFERYRIKLEASQFGFHMGHFKRMLDTYSPLDEETERVLAYMVEKYPASPKIHAMTAMQDVRLGRDTGEAWSGPAPWEAQAEKNEPLNPHSERGAKARDEPRASWWYLNFYPEANERDVRDLIASGEGHDSIVALLEASGAA